MLLVVVSALSFMACGDDPASVGSSFTQLIPVAALSSDSLSQSFSNYTTQVPKEASDVLLLGKNRNLESSFLLRFDLSSMADSLLTALKDNKLEINSVKTEMRSVYFWGNKNAQLDYSVRKINNRWGTKGSYNADSLARLSYGENIASGFYRLQDSAFGFQMDNQTVAQMLKDYASGTNNNYGFYFRPEANNGLIAGFAAMNNSGTSEIKMTVNVSLPGKYSNKNVVFYPSMDVHVITGTAYNPNDGSIYLQGGLSEHSMVKFDLTGKLPVKSMISQATIELSIDSSKSLFGTPNSSDSLLVRFAVSGGTAYDSSSSVLLIRNGGRYTGNVTRYVQRWSNGELNSGLLLSLFKDRNSVDLLALHGSNDADKNKRPKLNIIYATYK